MRFIPILFLVIAPCFSHAIMCRNSGDIEVDGQTIEVSNCQIKKSKQGGQGECAFILHEVKCSEWQGTVVVSQSQRNYPSICHVFRSDGFAEGQAQKCLDYALNSPMRPYSENDGPTFKSLNTGGSGGSVASTEVEGAN